MELASTAGTINVLAAEERAVLSGVVDGSLPYPPEAMRVPRGNAGGTQKVAMPEGYLDHLDHDAPPGAEAKTAEPGG